MAMTRKWLKALGIEEEKIDEIIAAHGETVSALKTEIENAKNDSEELQKVTKERDKLQSQLETLQKNSGDAAKVQAEFDAYKSEVSKQKTDSVKRSFLTERMTKQGANPDAVKLMLKSADLAKVKAEGDKVDEKSADELIGELKGEYGGFWATTTEEGTPNSNPPSGNSAPKTKAEIMAIKDTTARQKAIAEHQDLFMKG